MDDHVAQVHQYPFAGILALDAQDGAAAALDLVADRRRERLGLSVRGAGSDRNAVEQAGQVDSVVHADILRLDVFQRVDDGALQFFDVHLALIEVMLLNIV
jgi:hypothetical protein